MANPHVLAFTSQLTVERVPVLDPIALNDLASWLCREANAHDADPYWKGTAEQHERFEQQRRDNDGFCDHCRDFAGAMLVKFDVKVRD